MLQSKFTFGMIAAAAAMALPGAAHAATTITSADIGKTFIVDFGGTNNAGTINGLSGLLSVTIESFSTSAVGFSYVLENDSFGPITGSTISGFSFSVDPDISGTDDIYGVFTGSELDKTVPNIGKVGVCFANSGGQNGNGGACSGGGGVTFGDTKTGGFTLLFDASNGGSIELYDFAVRYQAISGLAIDPSTGLPTTSWSGTGSSGRPNLPPPAVPEPATWMMMLLGFGLVGASMRHRKGIAFRAQFA